METKQIILSETALFPRDSGGIVAQSQELLRQKSKSFHHSRRLVVAQPQKGSFTMVSVTDDGEGSQRR